MKVFHHNDLKSYLLFSSKSFLRILRFTSRQLFLPGLIVYPSNICNYKCVMCDEGAGTAKEVKKMDLGTLEKLLADCRWFFPRPRIHFSGLGEPLVHPDIAGFMQLCKRRGFIWSMTTNGYFLDTYAGDIVENRCRDLNVSIHGIGADHDRVTGIAGSFDQVVSGLKKLDEVKRNLHTPFPSIAINCVITGHNTHRLKKLLDYFTKLPVSSITFQHTIFSREDFFDKAPYVIHEEWKIDFLRRFIESIDLSAYAMKINFFPNLELQDIPAYYSTADASFNQSCVLPWLGARVYPDGNVAMCDNVYGNIRESSLRSIINSKKARAFRKQVMKNKFKLPQCFRCCHRHYY